VLARSEQYLSVRQIHQLLPEEGSPQGVRKSVVRLVEQGVIWERVTGRSFAYALNRDHLLAEAILKIANAKTELLSRMSQVISEWSIQPLTAKIFGSAARNQMRTGSDIDLFIVMPDSASDDVVEDLVRQLAANAASWTGNEVRPIVYRSSEVRPASIFNSILEDGIDISGDSSWLRRQLRKDKARA
jgi:predicted nucleotidyltransferase